MFFLISNDLTLKIKWDFYQQNIKVGIIFGRTLISTFIFIHKEMYNQFFLLSSFQLGKYLDLY